jgi:hypothetical protein
VTDHHDHKIQNSEILGFFNLSIVRYSSNYLDNTTFRKLDLFPSSGEEGDTYSVKSLRKN